MASKRPTVFVYTGERWSLPIRMWPLVYVDGKGNLLLLQCGRLLPDSDEVKAFLSEWRYDGSGDWVEAQVLPAQLTIGTS